MSPLLAAIVATWGALLIVYLGLAATLRKVHFLEAEVRSLHAGSGVKPIGVDLRLPGLAAPDAPKARLVVAVDSACASCHLTVEELLEIAPTLREQPILLTYETPDTWGHAAQSLRIRRDPDTWRALAHLSPPVLMTVDGEGTVTDLILVSQPNQVRRAAITWGFAELPARSLT
ncbi:MAG TPA: hypothetical protein VFC19_05955 [Candidatus Limnocylindrales bacterium]|nr:hypothetical protein [Candidatus Limnocylindrales bacterium]